MNGLNPPRHVCQMFESSTQKQHRIRVRVDWRTTRSHNLPRTLPTTNSTTVSRTLLNADWFYTWREDLFTQQALLFHAPLGSSYSYENCLHWAMAATNMFEPGWILIGFIDNQTSGPKTKIQIDPARLRPISIFYGTPNFPIIIVQTLNSSPFSNFHGGYKYVWAGLNPDWFHWGSSRDPKQFDPARLKPIPIFYGTPNFPIFFNQTINSSPSQTSMAATNMFEPGWILIGFIEDRLGDPKQFDPARLKPIPIFYGTPNFPIFFNQTINSSPSQTSMAATNMFEPGWILIGFIEDRLGDPKQFDPARLKPIPIFYGTPNFPIFINQTLNSSPSQTSMAATNMFEPGWILIGFIEDRLGDPKQFNPARLKPIPIFYGTPNFPIFLFRQ